MTWEWETTWITGASSGIGAALAREIAGEGVHLVLSGRAEERLDRVAFDCKARGARVEKLAFDLAAPDQRALAIEDLRARAITVEALINNAGVSQRGYVRDTRFSVDRAILEIDYLAAVDLTKAVLPAMLGAGRGCIVAVSSIAGLAGVPLRSSYGAAKAAQIRFFGALRNELVDTEIVVSTAIVGMAQTEISRNAFTASGERYGELDPNQADGVSPEHIARTIRSGVMRRRRTIYAGLTPRGRTMVLLARFAPRLLDSILSRGRVT